MTRNFLLKVLRRVFDHVQSVAGRHVGLCDSAHVCTEVALRPGDVLDVRTSDWVPALLPGSAASFRFRTRCSSLRVLESPLVL